MNTPGQEGFRLGYRPQLDGLRGISILAVMAYNAHLPFTPGAYIGVDIFFVLSGFLITSLLVEEWGGVGRISLKQFYMRRALRLLPALFLLILVCCAYAALFQPKDKAAITYQGAFFTLFYAANWVQAFTLDGIGALSHAWSLSVEEQFYLLWPLLLVCMLRLGWKRSSVLVFLSTLILAAFTWRTMLQYNGAASLRLYFGTDTRADALLIGCFVGLLLSWNLLPVTQGLRRIVRVATLCAIPLLLFIITQAHAGSDYMYYGVLTLISMAAAALILEVLVAPQGVVARILKLPLLVWIGQLSYGLYLWHFPVFEALKDQALARLHVPQFMFLPVRFAAAFALAVASFYLLEKPFLRLKKRFAGEEPNKSAALPASAIMPHVPPRAQTGAASL